MKTILNFLKWTVAYTALAVYYISRVLMGLLALFFVYLMIRMFFYFL